MYRYLAFIWNPAESGQTAAAEHLSQELARGEVWWQCVLTTPGLAIFESGSRPGSSTTTLLADGAGAVFGKVFRRGRENASATEPLDTSETAAIAASGGRALLGKYWGRYAVVSRKPGTRLTSILRSPEGSFPCLMTVANGIHIVCSNIEDCVQLGLKFTINWDYIAALVVNTSLQVRESGLNEVSEVMPGECVEIEGSEVRRSFAWHPMHFARENKVEDPEKAAALLREAMTTCVRAWVSSYDHVVHRLSGGLDSSIVLGCLVGTPLLNSMTCIHYYAHGLQEDERSFARAMAAHAGTRLTEIPRSQNSVDLAGLFNISRGHRPSYYLYGLEHTRMEAEIAAQHRATALFDGAGGDAMFYQARANLGVTDYFLSHGLTPDLFRIALDAAHVDRLSIWAILGSATKELFRNRKWSAVNEMLTMKKLMTLETIHRMTRSERFMHPWLEEVRGVPPGKLWHLASLSAPLPFYDPFGRPEDPEYVHPVLSQPVIEAVLRIPTFTLINGGWDRAMARRAFADVVPRSIIRRRSKGSATPSVKKIFDANLPFIRELLLDGHLVTRGLLDRVELEKVLSPKGNLQDFTFVQLLVEHIGTEVWIRRWLGA